MFNYYVTHLQTTIYNTLYLVRSYTSSYTKTNTYQWGNLWPAGCKNIFHKRGSPGWWLMFCNPLSTCVHWHHTPKLICHMSPLLRFRWLEIRVNGGINILDSASPKKFRFHYLYGNIMLYILISYNLKIL